ncbi:HlyD family efflux transporter periplasmic adaptor subunit [Stenotrophomonas sp. SY1]|uniref:HlyD family secretion protein n=1 Tax=Stenotrophomonas sp. SY1 TaxID=477235 RepID=UPI001E36C803
MSQPLFRDEVLIAGRTHRFGGISLIQPLRTWLLTVVAVACAIVIALFLCLGSYTRRSSVIGQLVPTQGLITVPAPATGLVSWLNVPEGERVRAGATLALVSVPKATLEGGDTQAALGLALQQRKDGLLASRRAFDDQLAAQGEGVTSQLVAARLELQQLESEVATRQQQITIANETLERLRRLEDGQYVSVLQIKQQQVAVLEYTGQKQALQREATATRRLVAQLHQAQREQPAQRLGNDADYLQALAKLEQEQVRAHEEGALLVKAPTAGMISSQGVKRGQAVKAGQPLMSLLPGDGRLEAEVLVPSHAVGFMAPGDKVLLRYNAFPYQKFGHQLGRISRISRNALGAVEIDAMALPVQRNQQGESFYRVTVELERQFVNAYGRPEPLRPGMLLQADIMGESRRLIEWAFEPLYSLQGRLSGA